MRLLEAVPAAGRGAGVGPRRCHGVIQASKQAAQKRDRLLPARNTHAARNVWGAPLPLAAARLALCFRDSQRPCLLRPLVGRPQDNESCGLARCLLTGALHGGGVLGACMRLAFASKPMQPATTAEPRARPIRAAPAKAKAKAGDLPVCSAVNSTLVDWP